MIANRRSERIFWALWLLVLLGAYAFVWTGWLSDLQKVSRDLTETIKVPILAVAMLLVILRWVGERFVPSVLIAKWRRVLSMALLALCLAAVTNYGRFGTRLLLERVDSYDLIHYYLGPKYFEELGYTDLYPALILADMENSGPFFSPPPPTYQAETDAGYELRPYADALVRGKEVKETRFTPERWAAFSHDFVTLQREYVGLNMEYWWQMVNDHGFNGTPAWTAYARPMVDLVPVEHVKWLGYIDLGILLGGVAVTWWAFGSWSAGMLVVFLTTTYSTRWPTISWSLLRYDYVVAMIFATALIQRGRPLLAGMAAGHAGLMRIFPLMYLWGPGVQGGWKLLRQRRIDRFVLLFFAGVLFWGLMLQTNVVARWGVEPIVKHWVGMTEHVQPENLSSRREGLAIALAYRGEVNAPWSPDRILRVERQEPLRKGIGLILLLGLGWALRKADRAEGYALGFLAFFLLTTASYYYYVVRAPLVQVHAAGQGKLRHTLGLLVLLGIDLFCNLAQQKLGGNRIFIIGWLGWLVLAYGVIMTLWVAWENRKRLVVPDPA